VSVRLQIIYHLIRINRIAALTNPNKDKEEIAIDDQNALEHGNVVTTYSKHVPKRRSWDDSVDQAVFLPADENGAQDLTIGMDSFADCLSAQHHDGSVSRKRRKNSNESKKSTVSFDIQQQLEREAAMAQWKRIMLLVVAITVHNIPEGLAVGVSFGAIGTTDSATFEAARNLAIGIGIQNFPEGLAVSLPLHAAGFSITRSFWYGQLSGVVEPIFGILGAVAVTIASMVLPYALSFAAGAMIYITADDILPEAHAR
jgi:solute carrier family 39 (zinc transporter), member 11